MFHDMFHGMSPDLDGVTIYVSLPRYVYVSSRSTACIFLAPVPSCILSTCTRGVVVTNHHRSFRRKGIEDLPGGGVGRSTMPSRKDEHPRGPNKRQRKIIDELTWKGKIANKPLLPVQDASPSSRSLLAHASPRSLDALPKDHIRAMAKKAVRAITPPTTVGEVNRLSLSPEPTTPTKTSFMADENPFKVKERRKFIKRVETLHEMAKTSLTRLDQFSTVGSIKIKRMPPVPDQGHGGREAQNGDNAGAQRGGEAQEQEGGGGKADSGSDHVQKEFIKRVESFKSSGGFDGQRTGDGERGMSGKPQLRKHDSVPETWAFASVKRMDSKVMKNKSQSMKVISTTQQDDEGGEGGEGGGGGGGGGRERRPLDALPKWKQDMLDRRSKSQGMLFTSWASKRQLHANKEERVAGLELDRRKKKLLVQPPVPFQGERNHPDVLALVHRFSRMVDPIPPADKTGDAAETKNPYTDFLPPGLQSFVGPTNG